MDLLDDEDDSPQESNDWVETVDPPVRWIALDTDSLSTCEINNYYTHVHCNNVIHAEQLTCVAREKELREMCSLMGIIRTP